MTFGIFEMTLTRGRVSYHSDCIDSVVRLVTSSNVSELLNNCKSVNWIVPSTQLLIFLAYLRSMSFSDVLRAIARSRGSC